MRRMNIINENRFKVFITVLVCLMMVGSLASCGSSDSPANDSAKNKEDSASEITDIIDETTATLVEKVPDPGVGSTDGDWIIIGTAGSATNVPDDYYNLYYDNVCAAVKSKKGMLSDEYYTEYSRVAIALAKLSKDPTDVMGYNLMASIIAYTTVVSQGINGPVYALIAANANEYVIDNEQRYVDYIVDQELPKGGFNLDGKSKEADASVTAMVIQSLAPYSDTEEVATIIEKAFDVLGELQQESGEFDGGCETISQVIMAISAIGEDPQANVRFAYNEGNLLDVLLSYQTDGGFSHEKGGEYGEMATEQALCALSAANSYKDGGLYNVTE